MSRDQKLSLRQVFHSLRAQQLRPDQLNAENQITDRKILGRDRLKFGIACVMYQSEEGGLGPLHTMIIRLLGGNHVAIGLIGGAGCLSSLAQCLGTVFLRIFKSNQKAMNFALAINIVVGSLLAGALWLASAKPEWIMVSLVAYLAGAYILACATGIQMNIESSWIGDLVPTNILGWFTSAKWIIGSIGLFVFIIVFGQIAEYSPYASTFAILFAFVALSHILAIMLMSTITDRTPQPVKFIANSNDAERINYRSLPLWCYIAYFQLWASGRVALITFSAAYMMDYFGLGMGKVTLLFALQTGINVIMLFVFGKLSDRFGSRKPLIMMSACIILSMLLWVGSAWMGIAAIIAYQIINGAAGNVHSMLVTNYGLEIFPARGRAAYLGLSRLFTGGSALLASIGGGYVMRACSGWKYQLWGAELTGYHLFFLGCTLFTAFCLIPLLAMGRRKVMNC